MTEQLPEVSSHAAPGTANARHIADMRVKLSILWVFAVLNYIYADVLQHWTHHPIMEQSRSVTG